MQLSESVYDLLKSELDLMMASAKRDFQIKALSLVLHTIKSFRTLLVASLALGVSSLVFVLSIFKMIDVSLGASAMSPLEILGSAPFLAYAALCVVSALIMYVAFREQTWLRALQVTRFMQSLNPAAASVSATSSVHTDSSLEKRLIELDRKLDQMAAAQSERSAQSTRPEKSERLLEKIDALVEQKSERGGQMRPN